ncbi:MAG: radical SAM protein [Candidatus Gastranaerophilales bacterium]|nr:radical SAM protein [Candidatus Gastranaerophilales bacterium]
MSQKLYFCDELNKTLTCMHDGIFPCCSGHESPDYYKKYNGQKINKKFLMERKLEIFEKFTEEKIKDSKCFGCYFLRERRPEDVISDKYNMLHISNWTHCNCGCIYCARMKDSTGKIITKKQKSEYYDMLPLLKQLYKEDVFERENLTVCIQGGDISVLKEFEPIMKELSKQGVKTINVLSNNIVYHSIVRKLLEKRKISFMTSLDCASRELYYKLKRVDKFDDCVNNLRKYVKNIEHPPVVVKYIVVEHINDNILEIHKFVDLMKDIGVENIEFMIDNKWALFTNLEETPFPSHYWDLYLFLKKECEKNNINFMIWDKLENDLNKVFNS